MNPTLLNQPSRPTSEPTTRIPQPAPLGLETEKDSSRIFANSYSIYLQNFQLQWDVTAQFQETIRILTLLHPENDFSSLTAASESLAKMTSRQLLTYSEFRRCVLERPHQNTRISMHESVLREQFRANKNLTVLLEDVISENPAERALLDRLTLHQTTIQILSNLLEEDLGPTGEPHYGHK